MKKQQASSTSEIPTPAEWLMSDFVITSVDEVRRDKIIAYIMQTLGESKKEVGLACTGGISMSCGYHYQRDDWEAAMSRVLEYVKSKLSTSGWECAFFLQKNNTWSTDYVLRFKLYTVKRSYWQQLKDAFGGYN